MARGGNGSAVGRGVKLVLDMNLSPEWVPFLRERGVEAVHWSAVGNPRAPDTEIMQWARDNEAVVFTHDLDFGILLAHTNAGRPSVIQVRTQDVSPNHLGKTIATVLEDHRAALETGALVTVDEARSRVRILPIAANIRNSWPRGNAANVPPSGGVWGNVVPHRSWRAERGCISLRYESLDRLARANSQRP